MRSAMSLWRTRVSALAGVLVLATFHGRLARAQGCVPSRFTSPSLGSLGGGGGDIYLSRGTRQVGFAYRNVASNQLIVGHRARNDLIRGAGLRGGRNCEGSGTAEEGGTAREACGIGLGAGRRCRPALSAFGRSVFNPAPLAVPLPSQFRSSSSSAPLALDAHGAIRVDEWSSGQLLWPVRRTRNSVMNAKMESTGWSTIPEISRWEPVDATISRIASA